MRTPRSTPSLPSIVAVGSLAALATLAGCARNAPPATQVVAAAPTQDATTPTPAPALSPSPSPPPSPGPTSSITPRGPEERHRQAAADLRKAEERQAIQRQANAYQARLLVDEARKAKAANDYTLARYLYNQALAYDPNSAAALEGRNEMLAYLGQAADDFANERANAGHLIVRPNQLSFDFDTAINDAKVALGNGDFATAEDCLNRARAAAAANPGIFSAAELHRFDARLSEVRKRIDSATPRPRRRPVRSHGRTLPRTVRVPLSQRNHKPIGQSDDVFTAGPGDCLIQI